MEEREPNAATVPDTEDWCFVCKDGGDLILCNNPSCSKVYHLECVGYDAENTSEIEETWTCDCHSCSTCKGASEVHCFCCPTSFCRNCIKFVKFAPLRDNNGLCRECWTLVRLAEKLSSSKKSVDFEDRDTYECLFKEYWEIVKEQEGLTKGDLLAAEAFSNGKRQMKGSTPTRVDSIVQHLPPPPAEDDDSKSKTQKFSGWGSKPLIDFLTSIGVDTTKQLSPCDVSSIIFEYIQERDLIHPIKKKKAICDKKLHLIFKKNTVPMKHIDVLLGSHFSDDQRTNNGNKKRCLESDQQNGDAAAANKQQKTWSFEEKASFASVVAHNIKLVYLRRSLVEDLLKQPESFEDKVVGSFVKVMKTGSRERSKDQKISQQLLQVTAVKTISSTDGKNVVVLHVCTLPDIQISMLSDSDITEEDCVDLREKMAKGLLQRPTVEEIEKKARILHQDIKKNWMERELVNLQNRIDRANEKGRRSELYQLIEQRQTLKKEAEQQPLLPKQLPNIIADSAEAEATPLTFTLVNLNPH